MLYKFIGGCEDRLQTAFVSVFKQGNLKFSRAHSLNDPQEFKACYEYPESRHVVEQWHRDNAPHVSVEKRRLAWDNVREAGPNFLFDYEQRARLLESISVACLTRSANIALLWAHYCTSHTGFVVEYDETAVISRAQATGAVIATGDVSYTETPPTVRVFKDDLQTQILKLTGSKSKVWSYEEEVRIVAWSNELPDNGLIEIGPDAAKGIVLGGKSPRSVRALAYAMQEDRPDFSVKQAVSPPSTYDIVFRPTGAGGGPIFTDIM